MRIPTPDFAAGLVARWRSPRLRRIVSPWRRWSQVARAQKLTAELSRLELAGRGSSGGSEDAGRRGLARSWDDDPGGVPEIEIRPWEFGLPLLVVLEVAKGRGWEPVDDNAQLAGSAFWQDPLRLRPIAADTGAERISSAPVAEPAAGVDL